MCARQSDRKEILHFVTNALTRIPDGANKK